MVRRSHRLALFLTVQNELLNRSLFELILPRDHDHLRDYLLKDHRSESFDTGTEMQLSLIPLSLSLV